MAEAKKGRIAERREKSPEEIKSAELDRADRANKRTFGEYVDTIEREIDVRDNLIDAREGKAASGGQISKVGFEELVMSALEKKQLEEQRNYAIKLYEDWFGGKFRQEV